ncbi:MAG: hypothetical protein ACRC2H_01080 [Silanimonas sp.]
MGNRAVIAASNKPSSPAIYLHWNGGPESVLAFLAAAKDLKFRDPLEDKPYGMAYLIALIAMGFGNGLSIGVGSLQGSDTDNGDNGTYYLGPGFTIAKREHNGDDVVMTLDQLSQADKATFLLIKARVITMWRAAQKVGAENN